MKLDMNELRKFPDVGAGLLLLEFLGSKKVVSDTAFERGARYLFITMLEETKEIVLTERPKGNDGEKFLQGFYQAFKFYKRTYLKAADHETTRNRITIGLGK